jgi:hypothetical protein
VDKKSLDDTRYDHSIVVKIVFELKILLGEGDWYVGPLGSDEGSLHPNMLHSSLRFLFCFLLVGSELELPMIGSTSFVTEGATTWLLNEVIISISGREFTSDGRQCWGLVLNCYESRTRQHRC